MSFEMVHAEKIFCKIFFWATHFHIEIASIVTEFITLLRLYNFVDMMQSMNGIFCW